MDPVGNLGGDRCGVPVAVEAVTKIAAVHNVGGDVAKDGGGAAKFHAGAAGAKAVGVAGRKHKQMHGRLGRVLCEVQQQRGKEHALVVGVCRDHKDDRGGVVACGGQDGWRWERELGEKRSGRGWTGTKSGGKGEGGGGGFGGESDEEDRPLESSCCQQGEDEGRKQGRRRGCGWGWCG